MTIQMKGMIFAAGLGTRLKPFTLTAPKALVPLSGVPMLERVIRSMAPAGIRDIVVNVHHFAPKIVEFLRRNDNFGLNIAVSDESDLLLDTGGGLLKARPLLDDGSGEPILLHNADIFTDLPLGAMIEAHETSGADVTLLCAHRDSSRTLYFRDNHLCGWQNLKTGELKPAGFRPDETADSSPFGGVHIVSPKIFPLLEKFNERLKNEGLKDEVLKNEGMKNKGLNNDGLKEVPETEAFGIVPFSIVPFYLAEIEQLDIQRFLLPDDARWFDVGSSEKLAAAEATFLR